MEQSLKTAICQRDYIYQMNACFYGGDDIVLSGISPPNLQTTDLLTPNHMQLHIPNFS